MPIIKSSQGNISAFPMIPSDCLIFLLFSFNLSCKELYIPYSHSIFTTNPCSGVYYYSCFKDEKTEAWKVKEFAHSFAAKLW